MSGSYEEALPPHTVAGHIDEVVRLAEMLAVDHQVGAPPERMVTSVVGIREFVFRLIGHFEHGMRISNGKPQFPFGFSRLGGVETNKNLESGQNDEIDYGNSESNNSPIGD